MAPAELGELKSSSYSLEVKRFYDSMLDQRRVVSIFDESAWYNKYFELTKFFLNVKD